MQESKKDGKPVFDIHFKKFLRHLHVECRQENTLILHNNGYAYNKGGRPGNLGVECNNSYFNRYIYIILSYFYFNSIINL